MTLALEQRSDLALKVHDRRVGHVLGPVVACTLKAVDHVFPGEAVDIAKVRGPSDVRFGHVAWAADGRHALIVVGPRANSKRATQ